MKHADIVPEPRCLVEAMASLYKLSARRLDRSPDLGCGATAQGAGIEIAQAFHPPQEPLRTFEAAHLSGDHPGQPQHLEIHRQVGERFHPLEILIGPTSLSLEDVDLGEEEIP